MAIKVFFYKVVFPIVAAVFLAALLRPLCTENGICDYRKLWMFMGIPFGIQKMYVWVIPQGFEVGGTIGMVALNFLVGGIIGGVVLVWRLIMAAFYLVKGIIWFLKKVAAI